MGGELYARREKPLSDEERELLPSDYAFSENFEVRKRSKQGVEYTYLDYGSFSPGKLPFEIADMCRHIPDGYEDSLEFRYDFDEWTSPQEVREQIEEVIKEFPEQCASAISSIPKISSENLRNDCYGAWPYFGEINTHIVVILKTLSELGFEVCFDY